ncbi:MAG TPA: glucuronate isomerase [Bacteroidales bacterium]|nr:glucuronate isomerase [Bacteroidales bacterium]
MKTFLDDNFLLHSPAAEELFHDHAKDLPIIDYHCHLPPEEIAVDRQFGNLTKIWLDGDHYKWRAMRANGVDESFCTGNAPDREKFKKWAGTVPMTIRNPLYHWTHLELKRYFGIDKRLDAGTADAIYDEVSEKLQSKEYSVRNLLRRMKVETLCTTDDPADSLENHTRLRNEKFDITVLPTWRPDKAMAVDDPATYRQYLEALAKAAGGTITHFNDLLHALSKRQDVFHDLGCRLSDHGLETFYADDFTEKEIISIFNKVIRGEKPSTPETSKFKTALLLYFAEMDYNKGWTQQFHVGAIRNNNSGMYHLLGPDKGFDSIGDFEMARPMSSFLNTLASKNKLAKTILYNLNPRDNELMATMAGNFNDGSVPGKMQYGSGWWFLDQKDGIEKQLNTLSNMGLLSRFVGMLTDSRSFLSYPRHEYFRRVLCNLIGNDVEKGELPADMDHLGKIVEGICYYNAKNYFGF